jgi:hypothetical protein
LNVWRHGYQFGYRFPALGNDVRLTMRRNSIKKLQALRLEITCANGSFHRNTPMVMCYGRIVAHPRCRADFSPLDDSAG